MKFLIGLSLLLTHFLANAIEPRWAFQVLRSAHFEVIYRTDQKDLAQHYALAGEQVRELLMPIFKEGPDKTIVVINDDTDDSNGQATFLPYPMITVFPVLPKTLDSIDDYGDWIFELMLHEYTHILNMYPAHGVYVPFQYIFGNVIRPNALLPKWYLEGLAVNLESRLSDFGRLRSDQTQASARALVLAQRLPTEDIAKINEQEIDQWPYGARPYLFGSWWWNYVSGHSPDSTITEWNQEYSRRLPYLLNGPTRRVTGKSAAQLWSVVRDELKLKAEVDLHLLNRQPPSASTLVAQEKGEVRVFALSPKATQLVYWVSRPGHGSQVKIKQRLLSKTPWSELPSKILFKTVGTLRVRWLSEERFVFDQLDTSRPHVTYRDLFLYDLPTGSTTRVTDGQRASEPAPSPSGEDIAFIQNDSGGTRLMLWNLKNSSTREVLSSAAHQRLAGPEFMSENELLFTLKDRGHETLHIYDLNAKTSRPWNKKLTSAQNPRWTPRGLLLSDSSTHVRNIYWLTKGEGAAQAVTHSLTEVDQADYDPITSELLFSELTAEGHQLRRMPLAQTETVALLGSPLAAAPRTTLDHVDTYDESYQPLAYLWPRYWIPFVYTLENDGLLMQGTTANTDPIGRNQYALSGAYDTLTKKPSYEATFLNRSLPVDVAVGYSKATSYIGATKSSLDTQDGSVMFSAPFPNRWTTWSFAGLWNETASSATHRRLGPTFSLKYNRLENPLNLSNGLLIETGLQQYLPTSSGYTSYARYTAHVADQVDLGHGHRVLLEVRGALAPDLKRSQLLDLGDRSLGANYLVNLSHSDFLLRGYPSGTFIGRKTLNANLEYALPVFDVNRGLGTFPMFWRALEIAAFVDSMAVDGAAYNSVDRAYYVTDLSHYFMSTGAELRLSTTASYQLPVRFTIGAYYGLNERYGGGFTPFLGLGLGDIGSIALKTP